MRVYHGTRKASLILAGGFTPSTGGEFGPGVYLTERIESARFWASASARGPEEPTIVEAEVDLKNPKRIDKVEWIRLTQSSTPSAVQRRWIKKGHDGILGVGLNGLDVQVVAFDPASIRGVRVVERLRHNAESGREEWVPEATSEAAEPSAQRLQRAIDALAETRSNPGRRGCGSRVRPGNVRDLSRYIAAGVNPCDHETFLPAFARTSGWWGDSLPPESGFDPAHPHGFLSTPEGSRYDAAYLAWLKQHWYSLAADSSWPEEARVSLVIESARHFERPSVKPASTWLIHFAWRASAEGILRGGFMGTPDYRRLAGTRMDEKTTEGWNFAYVIGEGGDYAAARDRLWGDWALAFQAPCVTAYHQNDGEWQSIFWGPAVRRAILLRKVGERRWAVVAPDGSDAWDGSRDTDLDDATAWARSHARSLWRTVGASAAVAATPAL